MKMLMNSPLYFDTMNLLWIIVHIKGLQVIIFKSLKIVFI